MKHVNLAVLDRVVCGEIWATDSVERNLEALCLGCGSRFAGTASEACTVELLTQLWGSYGLSEVHPEPFSFTAWQRGAATLEMGERDYPCLALPYAPACDLEAEMADMGFGLETDYAGDNAQRARERIVLVKNGAPPGTGHSPHRMEKYMLARSAGAAAFLFVDDQPGMLAPTGSLPIVQNGALDQTLPSAGVPYEVGRELSHRAANGPMRLRLRMENQLAPGIAHNVIGEIRGHDTADRRVLMVGAHMDGHDVAQGAVDNASGVVAITEIARTLAPLAEHLPCTVRFAAFGAEELGMVGSYAYVAAHGELMERIPFVFNIDIAGTGGGTTLLLQNCPELLPYFRGQLAGVPAEANVVEAPVPFSDNFPFTIQGVPASYIHSSGSKGSGRGWAHSAADTLDKVDPSSIRNVAAAVARLVLRVANDPTGWPGRRRSAGEVKSALEGYGVEPLMRLEGLWPF